MQRYKGTYYAEINFSDTDRYLRPLRTSTQAPTILQFNTLHTRRKTAICLPQIAVLLSTKISLLRLLIRQKYSLFLQFAESKFFKNYFLKVCQISKSRYLVPLREFLYKFYPYKLHTEGRETMSSLPSICEIAIRYFMSFWSDIKYAEIADKPCFFAFLRYSSGCRSPPSVSDFKKFTNQKRRKLKCLRTSNIP